MKVLGIVGSTRRYGNTEVAVKEALIGAKEAGAEVEIIRLTDFKIEPCRGCMRCVFKGSPCPINDDVSEIFKKLREADALVLGVPVYILGAAGILKMLLDRSMPFMFKNRDLLNRRAAAIIPYGVAGWEGLARAQVMVFLLSLGYRVIDVFMPRCQGPGEILLKEEDVKRCYEMGRKLALNEDKYTGEPGVCPICHNSVFEIEGLRVKCPVCNIYGHIIIEDGKLGVKFENPENHRWQPENLRIHFEQEVLPSAERYLKNRDVIKEKLSRYRW